MESKYQILVKEVFKAQNKARMKPKSMISHIQKKLKFFKGNTLWIPGEIGLMTQEGPKSYEEAIEFLKKQPPLKPLGLSKGMCRAAQDHADDTGPAGVIGHYGTDKSSMS